MDKNKKEEKTDVYGDVQAVLFKNAEEAWFWFIAAQEARTSGARFVAGCGAYPRPCEPLDILKVLDQLYRNRRLIKDHFLVLRHYGRRYMAPDNRRSKELCAYKLWNEALDIISPVLESKGIIEPQDIIAQNWVNEALAHEVSRISKIEQQGLFS